MNNSNVAYPSIYKAHYALIILLLAYILSFIDRNVLAILISPIREDFAISDLQFSMLHGWAFTLFYIFLGLPIGWLADRMSRKWIIIAGVFLWSLMTCLCGWAESFMILFLIRIGVGVGEAALSPPTYSMLSDFYTPERLRWATAIFTMGVTLGSGLSYKLGAWAYAYFNQADYSHIIFIADMSAWQLTFVLVGLPGFLIVLLLFFVVEPPRRNSKTFDEKSVVSIDDTKNYLLKNWQAYTSLVLGVCFMSVIGYGTLTWFGEFLMRTYDMARVDAGNAIGNIFMIAGTAGSLGGAFFASLLVRRGYSDANMRMIMLAAVFSLVPAVIAPFMNQAFWAIALAWLIIFFHYTHFGVAMAALQLITPANMRAQVSALMLFMTNLFGLALGGTFVAVFTDFVYQDDADLRYSLASVAAIVYPLAAITIFWGLKYYRNLLAENQQH